MRGVLTHDDDGKEQLKQVFTEKNPKWRRAKSLVTMLTPAPIQKKWEKREKGVDDVFLLFQKGA